MPETKVRKPRRKFRPCPNCEGQGSFLEPAGAIVPCAICEMMGRIELFGHDDLDLKKNALIDLIYDSYQEKIKGIAPEPKEKLDYTVNLYVNLIIKAFME